MNDFLERCEQWTPKHGQCLTMRSHGGVVTVVTPCATGNNIRNRFLNGFLGFWGGIIFSFLGASIQPRGILGFALLLYVCRVRTRLDQWRGVGTSRQHYSLALAGG